MKSSLKTTEYKKLLIKSLCIGVTLIFVLSVFPGLTQNFEYKVTDSKFKIRKSFNYEPSLNSSVALVQINDQSKKDSGLDLWPYDYYTEILKKIDTTNTVGNDIMFTLSVDTEGWEGLIDVMLIEGNKIISPYMVEYGNIDEKVDKNEHEGILMHSDILPLVEQGILPHVSDIPYKTGGVNPDLLMLSSGVGFSNIEPDNDGVLRRLPIVSELDGHIAPHFFLRVLASYADWDLKNMVLEDSHKLVLQKFPVNGELKDIEIPLDGNGNMLVNYISTDKINEQINSDEFQLLSAWAIYNSGDGSIPLKNKAVIFGDHSFGAKDVSATPIDGTQHNPIIFAMAMSNILNESFITPSCGFTTILATLIMLALLLGAVRYLNLLWVGVSSITLIVLYVILNFMLFIFSGIEISLFNTIIPVIVTSAYILGSLMYKTQVNMGVLEGSLRSYLSPVLMEKIKNNPDMLKLGGERKRITVMFSDIVGFTNFTDEADPAEVQLVLEDYFSQMTEVIFSNGGIVDKYLGDGILAFFENPTDGVISPQAALKSAISMQKKAEKLNQKYIDQKRFSFSIRVAIATGYAKVGNIGPKEKVDYTIIGSVVNCCSRLEGLGEQGDIVFDEETYHFIKDEYDIEDMGKHSLKGFEKEVQAYKIKINK